MAMTEAKCLRICALGLVGARRGIRAVGGAPGTVWQGTPRPAGCRRSVVANQGAREATRLLEDVEAVQPKKPEAGASGR